MGDHHGDLLKEENEIPSSDFCSDVNNTEDTLLPSLQEVLHCQLPSWYATFSNLTVDNSNNIDKKDRNCRSNFTIKSITIPLPDDFRGYLESDGVRLPLGDRTSSCMLSDNFREDEWSSDDNSDEEEEKEEESESPDQIEKFSFPQLSEQIQNAIDLLGGIVFPKLNWSCPKDAGWVNGGSLECKTAGDVYLLVKSSDFCSFDVHHALTEVRKSKGEKTSTAQTNDLTTAFPLQLVLRKWCNLHPSQEFRCFVRNRNLVGISQRHHSQYFVHLARDEYRNEIKTMIMEFFEDVVSSNFARREVANYVFDVYIDKKKRIWLLDFNVWGSRTDPLLFSWSELMSESFNSQNDFPEIRVVETDKQVRADPLASYRAPIDTIHVASLTGGIDGVKFEEFMNLCEKPTALKTEEEEL